MNDTELSCTCMDAEQAMTREALAKGSEQVCRTDSFSFYALRDEYMSSAGHQCCCR